MINYAFPLTIHFCHFTVTDANQKQAPINYFWLSKHSLSKEKLISVPWKCSQVRDNLWSNVSHKQFIATLFATLTPSTLNQQSIYSPCLFDIIKFSISSLPQVSLSPSLLPCNNLKFMKRIMRTPSLCSAGWIARRGLIDHFKTFEWTIELFIQS